MRAVRMDIVASIRRLYPGRVVALFVLAIFGSAACSSTTAPGTADTPPPPPPEPAPVLDFSAIAGDWAGEGTGIRQPSVYQIEMTLEEEAASGAQMGTITYKGTLNELIIDCGGRLIAREASGSAYELRENITNGVNCIDGGTIRLTHDAPAATLDYEWFSPNDPVTARATATLTRQE